MISLEVEVTSLRRNSTAWNLCSYKTSVPRDSIWGGGFRRQKRKCFFLWFGWDLFRQNLEEPVVSGLIVGIPAVSKRKKACLRSLELTKSLSVTSPLKAFLGAQRAWRKDWYTQSCKDKNTSAQQKHLDQNQIPVVNLGVNYLQLISKTKGWFS